MLEFTFKQITLALQAIVANPNNKFTSKNNKLPVTKNY